MLNNVDVLGFCRICDMCILYFPYACFYLFTLPYHSLNFGRTQNAFKQMTLNDVFWFLTQIKDILFFLECAVLH